MSLDLDQVGQQLAGLEKWLLETDASRNARLAHALDTLQMHSGEWEDLAEKATMALSPLLSSLAIPLGPLADRVPAPPPPSDFTTVAVDGSQIDQNRDNPFPCYLINIGFVTLCYGAEANASLDSKVMLSYREEDLFITDPQNRDRREPVAGALLHARRSVEETRHLAETVRSLSPGQNVVALIDNSLILWGLAGNRFDDYVKENLLTEYKKSLDELRLLAQDRQLAIAGYISRPGSSSVANLLRLALCGGRDCQQCRRDFGIGHHPCDEIAGILDRQIFSEVLSVAGDRSTVFQSSSKIVETHYRGHPVYFFYFNAGDEIARVEIPEWVARDPHRLELLHSVLYHQVKAGMGYPVSLIEAHEQAVVGNIDREVFWQMIEDSLGINLPYSVMSSKSQSKRTRAL